MVTYLIRKRNLEWFYNQGHIGFFGVCVRLEYNVYQADDASFSGRVLSYFSLENL